MHNSCCNDIKNNDINITVITMQIIEGKSCFYLAISFYLMYTIIIRIESERRLFDVK